jgi:hypothetical protein
MKELINEIYQFLFMGAIMYVIYILATLIIKAYAYFKLEENVTYKVTNFEKILLWISLSIMLTYLIN